MLLTPWQWPRWAVMWALAASLYAACKWLTWRRAAVEGVPRWRHVAYLLAWPGMDAVAFLTKSSSVRPSIAEWVSGAGRLALGLALFFGAARLVPADQPYMAGWIGMVGLVLVLHLVAFQSLFNARELASGGSLAQGLCGFIAVFWGVRLLLQGVFDVREHLTAWWLKLGYFALTVLFGGTVLYASAAFGVAV